MPKMSEGAWRSAAAIAVSVIAVIAVVAIVSGPYAGIIAGFVTLPVAIALDWETRQRREAALDWERRRRELATRDDHSLR